MLKSSFAISDLWAPKNSLGSLKSFLELYDVETPGTNHQDNVALLSSVLSDFHVKPKPQPKITKQPVDLHTVNPQKYNELLKCLLHSILLENLTNEAMVLFMQKQEIRELQERLRELAARIYAARTLDEFLELERERQKYEDHMLKLINMELDRIHQEAMDKLLQFEIETEQLMKEIAEHTAEKERILAEMDQGAVQVAQELIDDPTPDNPFAITADASPEQIANHKINVANFVKEYTKNEEVQQIHSDKRELIKEKGELVTKLRAKYAPEIRGFPPGLELQKKVEGDPQMKTLTLRMDKIDKREQAEFLNVANKCGVTALLSKADDPNVVDPIKMKKAIKVVHKHEKVGTHFDKVHDINAKITVRQNKVEEIGRKAEEVHAKANKELAEGHKLLTKAKVSTTRLGVDHTATENIRAKSVDINARLERLKAKRQGIEQAPNLEGRQRLGS